MSILARKRDLCYLIFFAIHIPIVLCTPLYSLDRSKLPYKTLTYLAGVDLYPLYPTWARPQFMSDLRKFYIDTYHDQFFTHPPAWFSMYAYMELVYHLPLSVWAVPALLRGVLPLPSPRD